jgi:hypothetical protein
MNAMKRIIRAAVTFVCIISGVTLLAQNAELSNSERKAIRAFVNELQLGQKELVAAAVLYPMERSYPLKPIIDKEEFVEHYDEFIDDSFIESVKSSEWERIGWRGICCGTGILWGDIDENGKFYSFSYRLTRKGQQVWKDAVERQRDRLYPGLRVFEKPVFIFKTTRHTIRVDLMPDNSYRYASWNRGHDISAKPDLVITGGAMNNDGSLHLEYYLFRNGEYEYEIGPATDSQDSDFELIVSRKGEELMRQYGNLYY